MEAKRRSKCVTAGCLEGTDDILCRNLARMRRPYRKKYRVLETTDIWKQVRHEHGGGDGVEEGWKRTESGFVGEKESSLATLEKA